MLLVAQASYLLFELSASFISPQTQKSRAPFLRSSKANFSCNRPHPACLLQTSSKSPEPSLTGLQHWLDPSSAESFSLASEPWLHYHLLREVFPDFCWARAPPSCSLLLCLHPLHPWPYPEVRIHAFAFSFTLSAFGQITLMAKARARFTLFALRLPHYHQTFFCSLYEGMVSEQSELWHDASQASSPAQPWPVPTLKQWSASLIPCFTLGLPRAPSTGL